MEQGEDDDEGGEINQMGGKNGAEQGEGKEEAIERFGFDDALDFGTEPEQERGPEDQHNQGGAGAGEVKEGGGKHR